jgi:hypothetical protein
MKPAFTFVPYENDAPSTQIRANVQFMCGHHSSNRVSCSIF